LKSSLTELSSNDEEFQKQKISKKFIMWMS